MKDFKLFSYLFSLRDLERKCHLQMRPVRAGPPKDTVFCLTFLLEQKHFISSGCLWGLKEKLREQNWGRNEPRATGSYPQNPTCSDVTVSHTRRPCPEHRGVAVFTAASHRKIPF